MYFAPFVALLFSCVMIWVLYAWVCLGLGWPFVRFFRKDNWQPSDFVWGFWIGLSVLLGSLQLLNLVVAINGFGFVLLAAAGLALSVGALPPLFDCVARIPPKQKWAALFASAAYASWIADRAAGHPYFYDSGLYHIPAMKWAGLYRIVPGLANLHGRLGLASSITLLAAMMDHGFLAGNVAHLLNGFLLTALMVMVVRGVMGFLADKSAQRPDHWVMLFAPLAVIEWAMDPQISSLSTDLATVVLTFAGAAAFLQLYSGGMDDQRRHFLAFTCLTLCAAALSSKISAAAFSAPLALGALWGTVKIRSSPLARLGRAVNASSLGVFITGVWMLRQVILSGYPFFPSALWPVNVDWRVPRVKVYAMQNAILDFARTADVLDTRHDLSWVKTWWHLRVGFSWYLFKGPVPLTLGITCFIITIFLRPRLKRLGRPWSAIAWMLLAIVLGWIAWFKAAPDFRLCSQLFLLFFAAGAAVLTAILLGENAPPRRRAVPLLLSLVLAAAPSVYNSMHDFHSIKMFVPVVFLPPGPDGGFEYTWVHTGFRTAKIAPNVTLYLPPPEELDRVWDAPLPNAPFLNHELQMRNPPHLRAGFRDLSLEPFNSGR